MGRKRQVSDEQILESARELFVENGFEVSTRSIAKHVGISESVLFQRFGKKKDLFFASMVPPKLSIGALDSPGGSVRETLENIFVALLRHYRHVLPVLLPLMSHPDFELKTFFEKQGEYNDRAIQGRIVAYLKAEHEKQTVCVYNPEAITALFFSAIYGLVLFERLGAQGGSAQEMTLKAMFNACWNGMSIQQ